MLHRGIRSSAIEVSLEQQIISDHIGGKPSLSDESMERQEIRILRLADECVEDGVGREDRGSAVGVDRVPCEERGLIEVVLADECEDAIVQVEAIPRERGDGLRELRGVRVLGDGGRGLRGRRGGGRPVEGGEWGLDAESALAAAALRGGFLGGGKGEEAEGDEARRMAAMRAVEGGARQDSEMGEEGWFRERHFLERERER